MRRPRKRQRRSISFQTLPRVKNIFSTETNFNYIEFYFIRVAPPWKNARIAHGGIIEYYLSHGFVDKICHLGVYHVLPGLTFTPAEYGRLVVVLYTLSWPSVVISNSIGVHIAFVYRTFALVSTYTYKTGPPLKNQHDLLIGNILNLIVHFV